MVGRETNDEVKTPEEWKATYFVNLAERLYDDAGIVGHESTIPEENEFLDIEKKLDWMYDRITNMPNDHVILTREDPYFLIKKPEVLKPERNCYYTYDKKIIYDLKTPSLAIWSSHRDEDEVNAKLIKDTLLPHDFEIIPKNHAVRRLTNIVRRV